jgi:hypothetical protein
MRNLVRAPCRSAWRCSRAATDAVFERYNIVSPGDLRDAARRLDAFARDHTPAIRRDSSSLPKSWTTQPRSVRELTSTADCAILQWPTSLGWQVNVNEIQGARSFETNGYR